MKKKVVFLFAVMAILAFGICYAATSGESNDVYVDSIEEYRELNGLGTQQTEPEVEGEDPAKEYYDRYQEYIKEYYDSFKREKLIKAKVLEVEKSKDVYDTSNYYSVTKYLVQKVKLQILEGDYKEKEVEAEYVRTGDSLDNIHFAELKKGDIVFVSTSIDEEGNLTASFTSAWSSVSRSSILYILMIIGFLTLIIYAGRKGLSAGLISVIAGLFSFVIIANFAYLGLGTVGVGLLFVASLIMSISFAHFGKSLNALKAMLVSAFSVLIAFILIWCISFITRTVGTTFEVAAIGESIVYNKINFEALYYMITLAISSAFITNTVCLSIKKIERESSQNFEERVNECRDVVLSNVTMLAVALFALYIPNHLLLLTNKFTDLEILNSETFVVEVMRFLVVAISMIISVTIISNDKLKIGKKYLEEAKDKNIEK